MMKKLINRISMLAILVIVLVIYSVILLATADLSKGVLWVGYGFTVVAAAISGAISWFTLKDPMDAEELYYQIPVSAICFGYVALAMVLGIVAACLPVGAWKGMLLVELVIHAIIWIILVLSLLHMRKIVEMQNTKTDKVINIRSWESRLLALSKMTQDGALSDTIRRLAEDVRFSDPMSDASVESMDREFAQGIDELQELVRDDEVPEAMLQSEKMKNLLKERNRQCRMAHSKK